MGKGRSGKNIVDTEGWCGGSKGSAQLEQDWAGTEEVQLQGTGPISQYLLLTACSAEDGLAAETYT